MAYHVDGVEAGENPHVNYEPAALADSRSAEVRQRSHSMFKVQPKISRTNDYKQAGERYRSLKTGSVMT